MSKALLVAVLTAAPLALIDYSLSTMIHLTPLYRLPILVIAYNATFLIASRQLNVFTETDLELLENALPNVLRRSLDIARRLLVRRRLDPIQKMIRRKQ